MKSLMTFLLTVTLTFLLTVTLMGCGVSADKPISKADVAAIEIALTTADRLAINYTSLPPCGGTARLCADPAIKAKIKTDAQKAYDAVKTLQRSETSAAMTAAQIAISQLMAEIPTTSEKSP